MSSTMLTTRQAAEYLGLAKSTLEIWRCRGENGLPYLKMGRAVRYRLSDLEAWARARTVMTEVG